MRIHVNRRLVAFPAAAALLLAVTVGWQVSHPDAAKADDNSTTAVSAGPATFTQQAATGNPSDYTSQLERCSHGIDYTVSGTNPILSEPLTTAFTSNVPLSVKVVFSGNQWYGTYQLVFTNTSKTPINNQCATIIFRGPSHADQHYYFNQEATGHPQSDYLEVPRGDGTSFYIVRLGFHDVAAGQQTGYAGETFAWQIGAAPSTALTLENIRDSIRFTADLTLSSNTATLVKYGTKRLAN
jgi:hypothetical protein